MKIAIIGSGALGWYYGSLLQKADMRCIFFCAETMTPS